ncbi:MAG: VOC family protein [Verrucomicrobia bacterium]|nr:VOC family protein [Verrucomicrobiota bacterium]MDA1088377.1 VOC family protein [Verrucomicrobiota bacterium]
MDSPIVQLDHVALQSSDLAGSCAFYANVLNLHPIERPAFSFPGAWFALGPGQSLHLIQRDTPLVAAHGNHHFAIQVSDFDAWHDHLQSSGVEIKGPQHRPDGVRQMYIDDPDGHTIEVTGA